MSGPLAGIRVLDLTAGISGPLTGRALADLGADVIKVEYPADPEAGQVPRNITERGAGTLAQGNGPAWERDATFNALNRGKRSVTLNLSIPEGRDAFLRLVAVSDCVLNNFSARVMPNLGLDFAALSEVNPRIIALSITGYGLDGPQRDYVAFGPTVEAESGLASFTGYPDVGPCVTTLPFPDLSVSVQAVAYLMLALWRRDQTGRGQEVDVSMLETVAGLAAEEYLTTELFDDPTPGPAGHRWYAPHGCFQGADGQWLVISVKTDAQWVALGSVLTDLGAAPPSPDWAGHGARLANSAGVAEWVAGAVGARRTAEVLAALKAVQVPAEPVQRGDAVAGDPYLHSRGFFAHRKTASTGERAYPGSPYRIDGARLLAESPPPPFGAHTTEVLQRLADLTEAEVGHLRTLGVV